jgi:hypothetical protein
MGNPPPPFHQKRPPPLYTPLKSHTPPKSHYVPDAISKYQPCPNSEKQIESECDDDAHVDGEIVLKVCIGEDKVKVDGIWLEVETGAKGGEMAAAAVGHAVRCVYDL